MLATFLMHMSASCSRFRWPFSFLPLSTNIIICLETVNCQKWFIHVSKRLLIHKPSGICCRGPRGAPSRTSVGVTDRFDKAAHGLTWMINLHYLFLFTLLWQWFTVSMSSNVLSPETLREFTAVVFLACGYLEHAGRSQSTLDSIQGIFIGSHWIIRSRSLWAGRPTPWVVRWWSGKTEG